MKYIDLSLAWVALPYRSMQEVSKVPLFTEMIVIV